MLKKKNLCFPIKNTDKYVSNNLSIGMNNNGIAVRAIDGAKYSVGLYDFNTKSINWGPYHDIDTGINVKIAVNDENYVVFYYNGASNTTKLYYKIGIINGSSKEISFGNEHYFTKGINADIALNNQYAIEVHQSENFSTVWYSIGRLNKTNMKLIFSHSNRKYDDGVDPSIALNNNNTFLEFHTSNGLYNDLWYYTGIIADDDLVFKAHFKNDSGIWCSAALNDNNDIVEVHESEWTEWTWFNYGHINNNTWAIDYYSGSKMLSPYSRNPSVDINNAGDVICSTIQNLSFDCEGYIFSMGELSTTPSYLNWIEKNYSKLSSKTLFNLTFPATHDSGAFGDIGGTLAPFVRCQTMNLFDQLIGGVRLLDLRLKAKKGTIYLNHGGFTSITINEAFNEIKEFLDATRQELVFIYMGEFEDFKESDYLNLSNSIKSFLNTYLYLNTNSSTPLVDTKLSDIISTSSRAILLAPHPESINLYGNLVCKYPRCEYIYDVYSNTTSFDAMAEDQTQKLRNLCTHKNSLWGNRLFLLSWTLTNQFTPAQTPIAFLVFPTNMELTPYINSYLLNMNKNEYPINFLYVDFYEYANLVNIVMTINTH